MLNYVKMVKFCEIWNSRVLLLLIIHMHGRRTWVGYDVCTQVDLRYRSVIHRTYSVSVQLVAYYVAIVSNIVIVTDYRVRQNKISQRESCDAYIMRARIFLNEIFHIYSSHTSWQVSLIVLSLLNVWWLAQHQLARWVQAVYDGTSLLVRRRTILPGGSHHAVGRCNCQTGLRSAASSSVAVPRTISSLGDRSPFVVAGPRAWNELPPPLRRVYSPDTFKRQLKTFLYDHAFNLHC